MDKTLGTLLRFWGVFTQAQPLLSPNKQCWTRVSRVFSEFQLCIGQGRENCKKICRICRICRICNLQNIAVLSQGLSSRIVDMTIINSNEDGQTHFVKRGMIERCFSRIVGSPGSQLCYGCVKVEGHLLKCSKDSALNQSDCGIETVQTFRKKNQIFMSHDRFCKSKKDKKTNEEGNVPLESYYYH